MCWEGSFELYLLLIALLGRSVWPRLWYAEDTK
jgi:hypothetical protein